MKTVLLIALLLIKLPTTLSFNTTVCSANNYFDSTLLDCKSCPSNSVQSGNGNSCACNDGFKLDKAPDIIGWKGDCTTCGSSSAPSGDGERCVTCPLGLNSATNDCACASGAVPVDILLSGEYLTTKECVSCDTGAFPGPDSRRATSCERCPTNYIYDQTTSKWFCKCDTTSGYTSAADTCILSSDLSRLGTGFQITTTRSIEYYSVEAADGSLSTYTLTSSDTFVYLYNKAVIGCTVYLDPQSCQVFANLCVLVLYNRVHPICRYYESTMSNINVVIGSDRGYIQNLPWLYYYNNPSDVINDAGIKQTVTFTSASSDSTNKLQFYIASYDIYGNYLGFTPLTNEVFVCPNALGIGDVVSTFGTPLRMKCNINLENYKNEPLTFYELYLKDSDGSFVDIPVKIANLRDIGDTTPNTAGSISSWKFTRRFFLFDTVSSISTDGGFLSGADPILVRYAKSIQLVITVSSSSATKINRPYFEITYRERRLTTISSSPTSEVSFNSIFELDTSGYWSTINTLYLITSVIIGVVIVGRTCVWYRHNPPRFFADNHAMWMFSNFLVFGVSTWGDIIFFFLFGAVSYCFIFFKVQDTVYFLIPDPTSSDLQPFNIHVAIMVIFQIISVLEIIRKQCKADIFFIDWEKPKRLVTKDEEPETFIQSAWRMVFIANELNELQTYRYVSIEIMFFIYGLFMYALDWNDLSAMYPFLTTNVDPSVPKHFILKYFLGVFLLFFIGMILWGVRKAIAIWIPTKVQEFTDLCSISNISLFILDRPLHGYYIHGQSPLGIAEGSAEDLKMYLEMESEGASRGRGLIANDPLQLQTFEIYIPWELRQRYDMIYQYNLNKEISDKRQNENYYNPAGFSFRSKALPKGFDFKSIEKKRLDLQTYLKIYIEGVIADSIKLIREKTWRMRFWRTPPVEMEQFANGSPLFFKDPWQSYQDIMISGHEFTMLLFDISLYLAFDVATSNTFLAIFLAYMIDKFVIYLRGFYGSKNISQKSLIDDEYLI